MKKYFIAIFCLTLLLYACKNRRFNSEDWKADKNRDKQINSLIKSKILIGKNYNEVVQLLGEEYINTRQFDSLAGSSGFTIQYLTGARRWIDFERLQIVFDSSKVISAEKYYD